MKRIGSFGSEGAEMKRMSTGFSHSLEFGLNLEFGIRKCAMCKEMKKGMYVVIYLPNGYFTPVRQSTCKKCVEKRLSDVAQSVDVAMKSPEAYMLAVKL